MAHLQLSGLLVGHKSQQFLYDHAVLHHSLHIDRLSIRKHLVPQAIDWPIPKKPGATTYQLVQQQ